MKNSSQPPSRELVTALRALRILVREIGGNYLAGLQSDLAHIEQTVREAESGKTRPRKRAAHMGRLLDKLKRLDVKPNKGRRRDLKRIEKLIGQMTDVVDGW